MGDVVNKLVPEKLRDGELEASVLLDGEKDAVLLTVPMPTAVVEGVGDADGRSWNAYNELSLLPTYSVPSEPSAGELTVPAVRNVHRGYPVLLFSAYSTLSALPMYAVPSAPSAAACGVVAPPVFTAHSRRPELALMLCTV